MRRGIVRLGFAAVLGLLICGGALAGPAHVFVRGELTAVSSLPRTLRLLVQGLDTGSAHELAQLTKSLREAVATVEGGRYYAERAESVYAEFDQEDVLCFAREYALWKRFIKDYPIASRRGQLVWAHWMVAWDRVKTVTGFDEAADCFQAVAEALSDPQNELERHLKAAAAANAQLLMRHDSTGGNR